MQLFSLQTISVILFGLSQTSAVFLQCTDKVQEAGSDRSGINGFTPTYYPGNRISVNMAQAFTHYVQHNPEDLHHKVDLKLDAKHFDRGAAARHQQGTRFHIRLQNDDNIVRHAQVAWSDNLLVAPLFLFTFQAQPHSVVVGCVETAWTMDSMHVTLQGF